MARPSSSSSAAPSNGKPHPTASSDAASRSAGISASTTPGRQLQYSDSDPDSPGVSSAIRRLPFDPSLLPRGSRSLSLISIQAFGLGLLFAASLAAIERALYLGSTIWRIFAFSACLSVFHFLEFWTTAHYNLPNARASSFLIWSNKEYNYAHLLAMVEILVLWLIPRAQSWGVSAVTVALGFTLVVLGQGARSAAMVTAGTNFNHIPAKAHKDGHVLVTTGIYRWLRHPSYFGFFWWALGTQILVGNKLCLLAYLLILWVFFKRRIMSEERSLVKFFGGDYLEYRKQTSTGIPFIR